MNTSARLLLISLIIVTAAAAQQRASIFSHSTYDVFPLKAGVQYTYSYSSLGNSGDDLYSSSSQDSGIVRYWVVDSTLSGDSLVVWNVIESVDVMRKRRSYYTNTDSLYKVKDSSALKLYEFTNGFHEIVCSGAVWKLPLSQLRGSIKRNMFRYLDVNAKTFSWVWTNVSTGYISGSGRDTVQFSNSLGFEKRVLKESWSSGYLWGTTEIVIHLISMTTGIEKISNAPTTATMEQNYPNPFNPSTTIKYTIPERSTVRLSIFNTLGQKLSEIVNETKDAGSYEQSFTVLNLSSGIYFYRIEATSTQNAGRTFVETKKMILMK